MREDDLAAQWLAAMVLRLRQERGLTQTELAKLAGLNSGEISRIECGRREPRLSTIVSLAAALEVNPGELFPR